ncbi:MAG: glycoside hydrolase family 28 protein [Calditrichaeota bacterium]|nr:glycoside hydrolase family 28 protein [Calditrichota bacterium]
MRFKNLRIILTLSALFVSGPFLLLRARTFVPAQNSYNVLTFGAKADGKTKDTTALQKAIDECRQNGGGTVYFPAGVYLSGSLHLKSNVTLYLDNGATLLASPDDADFDPFEKLDFKNDADKETSYFHFSFIWGEDVDHIAIFGQGTIDSNRKDRSGPKTIGLKRCRYVTIKDITIRNAGNYSISMLGTDDVNIDGVSIFATYCDGIDPDCCHNVRISNCYIESWDDAICPKTSYSLGYHRSTENLTVTNCIIATNSNAFKLGTESGGDFKHITVSNCVMTTYKSKVNYREPSKPISGISLISVDGAHIDDITITNISMDKVRFPIFLRLGNRGRDQKTPVPGTLKNIVISNITASDALIGGMILGMPGHPIENVNLQNIKISCKGGGTIEQAEADIKKAMKKYPSAFKFRGVPTFGIYTRHAKGVVVENFQLTCETPDARHALVCNDVADLTIDALKMPVSPNTASQLFFQDVRNADIRNCRPGAGTELFLEAAGKNSNGIILLNNDFSGVKKVFLPDKDIGKNSVKSEFNF